MKKLTKLLLFLLSFQTLEAQINVLTNNNATQLAQQLAGVGVTISNATLVCPTDYSGTFDNAPSALGINDGVILATGSVLDIPDSPINFASTGTNNIPDFDLDTLLASLGETYSTNDICALEFDITVVGDTLNFSYVMGSEEYPEYVCGSVNDIFGFFITGPNPSGGNYNNENVALIPNTNIPVSINTVNDGAALSSAVTCYDGTYSNYFNDSILGIVYDGNTVKMTATATTVPCGSYHFKLAIGDGGDNVFDSGVFLEAGSFTSTGLLVSTSSILGQGFSTMVEGCVDGQIEFVLENGINLSGVPYAIPLTYTGSATVNTDYLPLPDTVWIAHGDSSVTINVIGINDNISEPLESIDINVLYPCGSIQVASLDISDVIPIVLTPPNDSICFGDTVTFEIDGGQTTVWNVNSDVSYISDPLSDSVQIVADQTTSFDVFYTLGTCADFTNVDIVVSNLTASLNPTPISCPGFDDGSINITTSNAIGPVTYDWNTMATTNTINNLAPGIYSVEVSDGACDIQLQYDMINPSTIDVDISTGNLSTPNLIEDCIDGTITYTLGTGPNTTGFPFPIVIDFAGTATEGTDYQNLPDTVWIAPGDSSVTININTIGDAIVEFSETVIALVQFPCGMSPLDSIQILDQPDLNLFVSDSSVCTGDFVSMSVFVPGLNMQYLWEPDTLFFNPTSSFVSFNPESDIDITLTASIGNCDIVNVIPITTQDLEFDATIFNVSCPGEDDGAVTLLPTQADGMVTYDWGNGITSQSIFDLAPGTYIIFAFDESFCFYEDTFEITEAPLNMSLDASDTIICENGTISFVVNDNLSTSAVYSWEPQNVFNDNSIKENTTLPLSSNTTFTLTGTNPAGCFITEMIDITVVELDIEPNYTDTTVGSGTPTDIGVYIKDSANLIGEINFDWTPSDYLADDEAMTTTTTPDDHITYTIIAQNNNCRDTANINVFVGLEFQMPNAFTPNNDGINDVFEAVLDGGEVIDFRVYNRWGALIHNDPTKGWDGRIDGVVQPSETYQYYITVKNPLEEINTSGSFTLLK